MVSSEHAPAKRQMGMDKHGGFVDPVVTMTRLAQYRLLALSLATAGLLAPRAAFADVPPEESEACEGKATGQPCTLRGQAGSCQPGKCSRLDYSQGTPPAVVESDCVRCTTDPAANPGPGATSPDASAKTEPPPVSGGRCSFVGDGAGVSLALLVVLGIALRRRRTSA